MKITRSRPSREFVIIPNAALNDRRLSWRARGLLAHMLAKPPEVPMDSESLAEEGPDGRDAVRTGLRELAETRYLIRSKTQDARGRWSTTARLYDAPQPPDDPAGGSTDAGPPDDWETDAGEPVPGVTSDDGASPQVAPTTGNPTVGGPGAKDQDVPQDIRDRGSSSVPSPARESTSPPFGLCRDHFNWVTPPPCGACADARRARAAWFAAHPGALGPSIPLVSAPACPHHEDQSASACTSCARSAQPAPTGWRPPRKAAATATPGTPPRTREAAPGGDERPLGSVRLTEPTTAA